MPFWGFPGRPVEISGSAGLELVIVECYVRVAVVDERGECSVVLHLVFQGGEGAEDGFARGDVVLLRGGKIGDCTVYIVYDLGDYCGPSFSDGGEGEG